MDKCNIFQDMLDKYGGYQRIATCQARYLLRYLETSTHFSHDMFHEKQILRHIMSPTYFYNFWDLYTRLIRDARFTQWRFDIEDRPARFLLHIESPCGFNAIVRYKLMLPHGIYTWTIETETPHNRTIVSSHEDLSRTLFLLCWKRRMRDVLLSLILHPRIVSYLLIEEQQPLQSWMSYVDKHET